VFEFLTKHVDFNHEEVKESPNPRNPLYASNKSPSGRNDITPSNISFLKKGARFDKLSGNDA